MYDIEILDHLPEEPFKVTHNEGESLGGLVNIRLDGFTFWDGSRTIDVETSLYDAKAGNGTVKFSAPEIESSITFRPLALSDRNLLINGDTIKTLDDLREAATALLEQSAAP